MKVITTNLLSRFWKNGVLPIKNAVSAKLDATKIVNNGTCTETGFMLDARQANPDIEGTLANQVSKINSKLNASLVAIDIPLSSFRASALTITPYVPNEYVPFAFIIKSGLESHVPSIWHNLANGEWHISFRIWSNNELVSSGDVSGILLCKKITQHS